MKSPTEHLRFEVPDRRGFINITPKIEELVHRSGVTEGIYLVNAMHIGASVSSTTMTRIAAFSFPVSEIRYPQWFSCSFN
jgi:thiamine phosphate synthase YjbQ (UPF0047 family)